MWAHLAFCISVLGIRIQVSKLGSLRLFINSDLPCPSPHFFCSSAARKRTILCSQLVQNVPVLLKGGTWSRAGSHTALRVMSSGTQV